MARQLFGTDGVRGVAGEFLTAELALALARAAAARVAEADAPAGADHPRHARVGRDARGGGRRRRGRGRRRRAARRRAADARPRRCWSRRYGLRPRRRHLRLPQPVPRTTASSSSAADGFKLSDATEDEIEARARRAARRRRPAIGRVQPLHGALEDYLRALHDALRRPRPAAAAASCSTAPTAPPTGPRRRSSAASAPSVDVDRRRARRPQHQRRLRLDAPRRAGRERCRAGGHDAGFAFDGDGDRVLAVDRNGAVVDGDELIALAALHLREQGRLPGDGVAVTVMTNYGFHTAMAAAGRRGRDHRGRRPLRARGAARARLGARRRAVRPHHRPRLRALRRRDRRRAAHAGGARRDATSPTATRWRSCRSGSSTCALPTAPRWPRRADPGVQEAIDTRDAALEGRGRVLVRPSGTEPLVRVMVEAPERPRRPTPSAAGCVGVEPSAVGVRDGCDRRPVVDCGEAAHRGSIAAHAGGRCAALASKGGRHVRHRRLRRRAAGRGTFSSPDSRSSSTAATTPPASPCSTEDAIDSVRAVGNLSALRERGRRPRRRRPAAGGRRRRRRRAGDRASATRAGPPTAASPRRTPTRTSTRRPRPHRGQRDRRELHRAQASAWPATARSSPRRPTPRSIAHLIAAPLRAATCVEAVRARLRRAARPLRVRRDGRRRARRARRRAQGVPAGRRPRRGRAVPRLGRSPRSSRTRAACSTSRTTRSSCCARDGVEFIDRRRRAARARGRRDRLGRRDRREGRLRDVHAQGDPRAGRRRGRDDRRPHRARRRASTSVTSSGSDRRRAAARRQADRRSSPAAPRTTPA